MRQMFWNTLPEGKGRRGKAARLGKRIILGAAAWIGAMWLLMHLAEGSPVAAGLAGSLGIVGLCVFIVLVAYYWRIASDEEKDKDRDVW